ncbi:hypothetical protein X772_20990 [Mesorhizobium sp. LSJC280B00]|nr:hypothetical protein X772_20990 [Mesorhizobium sp. LSJC280B00]
MRPFLHRWKLAKVTITANLPPRGGDVRQDREGREGMGPSIVLVDDFGKIDKARRRMKFAFFADGATFCSCFVPAGMLLI